jgi:dUTP pyrophosphatase
VVRVICRKLNKERLSLIINDQTPYTLAVVTTIAEPKSVLKIQKLADDAIVPDYSYPDDSGMNLYALEAAFIPVGGRKLVKTGISVQLPPNTEGQVRPRSGLALKYGISITNSSGTIDEGYRGEIGIILENRGEKAFQVEPKMKIAQMIIAPVVRPQIQVVDDLSETERGQGGFGSTGV